LFFTAMPATATVIVTVASSLSSSWSWARYLKRNSG